MALRTYRVVDNDRTGPYSTLTLQGEVAASQPGQFYMLRGDWGADPLLGRPISILGEDAEDGTVRFLVKEVGEGTRRLCSLEPGAKVFGLGPLGRPFPLPPPGAAPAALVGGGVGVPPMVYLAARLAERALPFRFFQGARTAADLLCLEDLARAGVDPVLTTEDGSLGLRGLVTEPLRERLAECSTVYACGPEGMLKAVQALCDGRVPSYLSLEARMGCGYGVCLGCVVPVERNGRRAYERVCAEGPVFEGEVVRWA
ncbi:MAG: dihydroorotate dehydrogenase electron transfer subunit [Acidobacteriota bacterium]